MINKWNSPILLQYRTRKSVSRWPEHKALNLIWIAATDFDCIMEELRDMDCYDTNHCPPNFDITLQTLESQKLLFSLPRMVSKLGWLPDSVHAWPNHFQLLGPLGSRSQPRFLQVLRLLCVAFESSPWDALRDQILKIMTYSTRKL